MITIEKNCAGQCAKCESEDIHYGAMVYKGDYVYYPYDCQSCGNEGKEYHTLVYDITETTIE